MLESELDFSFLCLDKFHVCVVCLKVNTVVVNLFVCANFLGVFEVVIWSWFKLLVLIFDFWGEWVCFCCRRTLLLGLFLNLKRLGLIRKYTDYSWNRNWNFLLIKKSSFQILLLFLKFLKFFVTYSVQPVICLAIVRCISVSLEGLVESLKTLQNL